MEGLPSTEEVLQHLGITYKIRNGEYIVHCINPEHSDKNPSMGINAEGVFHCFSCGFKGNLNTIVKTITGRSIYQEFNIKDVRNFGFKREYTQERSVALPKDKDWQSIFLKVEGKIEYNFYSDKKMLEYIRSIGVYSDKFLEERKIGYVTNIPILINKANKFYNRVLFPVYRAKSDRTDILINIEARDFTGMQKPKVFYPRDTTTDYLYNWQFIDPDEPVIVVEGIKDLCKVWNVNRNVVSTFGTNLGKHQIEMLKTAKEVIFFIDNDEAGRRAIEKYDDIEKDRDFYIAVPPREGADPNDLSLAEIEECLKNKKRYADRFLDESKQFESLATQITY